MAERRGSRRAERPGARRAAAPAGLAEAVGELALLSAASNLMVQTAFLTMERLRISSEVVDEAVEAEFGNQLFERCEKLCEASDRTILALLDKLGLEGERADVVRSLVAMREEFRDRARRPGEQRRLLESLERMYR